MDADEVLETKSYLSRIRQWPSIPEEVNPSRWLNGFAPEHKDHALALLDSFVFISARQTQKLFTSTFHALSSELTAAEATYHAKRDKWRSFLKDVVITAPTGEQPNPSDSGFIFQRFARTALRVSEDQLVNVSELRATIEAVGPRPVVLVDDFAGSGNQFIETWTRRMWPTGPQSLAELTAAHGLEVYYLPLICTTQAAQRLATEASDVRLRPCHVLTEAYSASHPESVVFPEDLRGSVPNFIREASARAGITLYPNGFCGLELAVAFEHSIPDANLGVLWSEESAWFPLMTKP